MGVNPIFQVTTGFMVLPAGQGQVPHPSIVPEYFTINQLWNDRYVAMGAIVYCLNSGSEVCRRCYMKGNTRNRWRDGPVCPAADKELWRLGPDSSRVCFGVLCANRTRDVSSMASLADRRIRSSEGRAVNTTLLFKKGCFEDKRRKGPEKPERERKRKKTEKRQNL
ncbi:hypothetical protein TNCV_3199791 [Trichonephila clavipes]|nr:hypothetical protein TNCV_3199791 [Trichonephila clavipes]